MYTVRVQDHIDAAHFLKGYEGPCKNIHGHTWRLEVVIKGRKLSTINMLIDFKVVKEILKKIIKPLDHNGFLNDNLKTENPTAEFLAKWLFVEFVVALAEATEGCKDFWVSEVTIWESAECSSTYNPEKGDNDAN